LAYFIVVILGRLVYSVYADSRCTVLVSTYDAVDALSDEFSDMILGPICVSKSSPVAPAGPQLAAWTFEETHHGANCTSDFESFAIRKESCVKVNSSTSYSAGCSDGLVTYIWFRSPNCDLTTIEYESPPNSGPQCRNEQINYGGSVGYELVSTSGSHCTSSGYFGRSLNLTAAMPDKKLIRLRYV
jgi:hypothetical protein